MEEISGSLKGRFVDDDDIVRTGRAMIEINGWDFLHVPIPVGLSGKLKSFESAMDSRLVKSREDAEAAASSAGEAADSAEEARGSASAAEASAGRASGSESAAAESESAAQGHAKTAEGHANAAQEQAQQASSLASAASTSAEEAKGHASRAQQSAEESGRAADRAEGARGEARTAWDGAKEARDAAQGHASTAEGHANAAASSAGDAQGAAGRADESAQQVREIAESTQWDGDQVTVNGKQSPHLTGPQGQRGPQGPPGTVEGIDFSQYAKVEQLSDVVRRGQDGVEMGKHFSLVHDGSGNFSTSLFLKNGQHEYEFFTNAAGKFGAWDKTNQRGLFQADRNTFEHQTAVDMRNNQLRGLPAPAGDNHAATKQYVDSAAGGKQDKAQVLNELSRLEGTTTTISGHSILNDQSNKVLVTDNDGWVSVFQNPRHESHVAHKKYVDEQVSAVRDRVGALESKGGGVWVGSKGEYDRLDSKDSSTLYVIK
nr:MAG TPA: L SHAPED TAIL FIBER PROTEIN [Caudoviricetes sp.]